MPEGTWDPARRRFDTSSSAPTVQRGVETGQDDKYDAIQRKTWEDEYNKSVGATGIAGAGKRSKPEYKTGLAGYLKKKAMDASIERERRKKELADKVTPKE